MSARIQFDFSIMQTDGEAGMRKSKLMIGTGVSALAIVAAIAFAQRTETGEFGLSAAWAQESGAQQGNQGGQGQGSAGAQSGQGN